MASDLEGLRARSNDLAKDLGAAEALQVNAAIVELDPDYPVAVNRLGIGLLQAARAEEAIEVLEAGVARHPENSIMATRLAEARRTCARAAASPPTTRGPLAWLKALHHQNDGWTIAVNEETWISDAGRIDASGARAHTASGDPWGRPSWQIGDAAGLYYAGTRKVPIVVEIIEAPVFDPAFVARESKSADDGERWPWVTRIRGISSMPLPQAPTLDELGIESDSVRQLSRMVLSDLQLENLIRLHGLGGAG